MSHIIKKQVLMLDIPKGYDSWRVQDNFKTTFNQQVLPKLDAICQEMGIDNSVTLKLDKLLIDTGVISTKEAEKEWVLAIENQFREQLRRLKHQKSNAAEQAVYQSPEASEIAILTHFLDKGVMPWWVSADYQASPNELLTKLLSEQPVRLAAAIKKLRNKVQMAERLVKQFKKHTRKKLIDQLASGKRSEALEWLEECFQALDMKEFNQIKVQIEITQTLVFLDETIGKYSPEKLFQLFFDRFQKSNFSAFEAAINSAHKQLINSNIKSKNKVFIQEKELTKTLIQLIESSPVWQKPQAVYKTDQTVTAEKTKTSNHKASKKEEKSTVPVPTGKDIKTNKTDSWSWSDAALEAEEDQKDSTPARQENEPKDSNGKKSIVPETQDIPNQPAKESLSEEDKHVWGQIERIKEATKADAQHKSTQQPQSEQHDLEHKQTEESSTRRETASDAVASKHSLTPDHSQKTAQGHTEVTRGNDHIESSAPKPDSEPSYWQQVAAPIEECYVQNAGLVLFWPFLAHFFRHLGMMQESHFKTEQGQEKAALTLQFLLSDKPELEEFLLPLNKLLVGLPAEYPLENSIELNGEEYRHCQELLEATISNWEALKGTSVAGFQGTFLHRSGVLKRQENGWLLQVERKPFDMLMEQLPWPISIVRLTWMNEPIYVEW